MSKLLKFAFIFAVSFVFGANAAGVSCGSGYVLTDTGDIIDGITVSKCQKLWCVDLENGKKMGSGDKAASGYIATMSPDRLCDNEGTCIECWGERRWCAGEAHGVWNPKYGAYTRSGNDSATYESYQKGGCFAWSLEKPNCESGQIAVLQGDEWVCAETDGDTGVSRESAIRRTGNMRRIKL
jgi:hypothetical protein